MTEITIQLPDAFAKLPDDEREHLIRVGLRAALTARIRELEIEHAEATAQVEAFEKRYGMSLGHFERELLPGIDSYEGHEAYNDWCFWQNVAEEKEQLLAQLRQPDLS